MFSNIAERLTKNVATDNITFSISEYHSYHSFSFCLIFFLIIISASEMLKYMTGADIIRAHF